MYLLIQIVFQHSYGLEMKNILEKLYPEKIVIPQQVYDEINRPFIAHLKNRVDQLVARGSAVIMTIDIGTDEYEQYRELTTNYNNTKVIGKGEAASISLAKEYNGILASNNLKDVKPYVEKFSLRHITTGDILVEAFNAQLITEEEANNIWSNMLKKKRMLGANSFSDYLSRIKV